MATLSPKLAQAKKVLQAKMAAMPPQAKKALMQKMQGMVAKTKKK